MNTRKMGTAGGRTGGLLALLAALGLLLAGCTGIPGRPAGQEAAVTDQPPWPPSGGVTVPGVVLDGSALRSAPGGFLDGSVLLAPVDTRHGGQE